MTFTCAHSLSTCALYDALYIYIYKLAKHTAVEAPLKDSTYTRGSTFSAHATPYYIVRVGPRSPTLLPWEFKISQRILSSRLELEKFILTVPKPRYIIIPGQERALNSRDRIMAGARG